MEEKEHGCLHEVETSSELDAMDSECSISPSQEETLNNIAGWPSSPPHSRMLCSSSQQEFASQDASTHPFLNPTVGARITEFCSPLETSTPWEGGEDNSQTDFVTDSFDPRFESDRDRSPSTQADSAVMTSGPGLHPNQLTTGIQTPDKPLLLLQEASSANLNNNANVTTPRPSKISPKTATCRQIFVDKEGQLETTLDKSPLNLAPDKPTSASQPLTQSEATMDPQFLSRGDLFNYQLLANVAQISSQLLPTAKSQRGLDMQATSTAEVAECQGKAIEIEGSRAHRILPSYLAGPSVQRDTTAIEIEKGPEQLKDDLSKRRRRDPRPFPETLMDAVIHYSGDPPVGFEDVDIVQAAIKAGMVFPPPICRHSFPRYQSVFEE